MAALNGTLRDDENQICTNCGATGHRKYECSETQNFTINLTCRICNGHGHTARDCMERNNPEALQQAKQRDQKLDSEYLSLMAELGENVDASKANDPSIKTVSKIFVSYKFIISWGGTLYQLENIFFNNFSGTLRTD